MPVVMLWSLLEAEAQFLEVQSIEQKFHAVCMVITEIHGVFKIVQESDQTVLQPNAIAQWRSKLALLLQVCGHFNTAAHFIITDLLQICLYPRFIAD